MSLSQFFGKHEKLSVALITLFFFLISFQIINNWYGITTPHYKSIEITYQEKNNSLIIQEHFSIDPSNEDYQVLYRSFAEKACLDRSCNMRIQEIHCNLGKPYFASNNGNPLNPKTKTPYHISYVLARKIRANEGGCFLTNTTYAGKQEIVTLIYEVPLEHIKKNNYLHYFFSENHFPIHNLIVHGLEKKGTKKWLPKNKDIIISVKTGTIKTKNMALSIALLLAFLFSALPFIIWYFFGKEKSFFVPEYLHTIPNTSIEPWQVDVLTNGTFKLSKNGAASALLELYVHKILEFREEKKYLIFKNRTFLLRKNASPDNLSSKARSLYYMIKNQSFKEDETFWYCKIPNDQMELQNFFTKEDIDEFLKKHIDNLGYSIMIFIQATGFFLISLLDSSITIYLLWIISFMLSLKMSTVFSRFKGDSYKMYLEWLSFKKMLTDFAQIQKYLKEDYQQWKSWLLYATALGATENLIKAMKELQLLSPQEIERLDHVHHSAYFIAGSLYSTSNEKGSQGGIGSIGSGGGFGGGGGGGR